MENFIKNIEKGTFEVEMIVNGDIFSLNNVLKASYELVDKVYMFFKSSGSDYLVQFKLKDTKLNLDEIVKSFGEELVYHKLRADIEKQTGKLREKIIETALGYGVSLEDIKGDISKFSDEYNIDGNNTVIEGPAQPQPKSIEDIISEIESDPDFADDKDEIIGILKEIEEEDSKK